jgi:plastocyanin
VLVTRTATALGAAALLSLTACGGGEDDPTLSAPTTTGGPTSGATTGGAAPAAGSTLLALVGTKDSPQAFEISLTDEAGNAVTTLAAGTYSIKVTDESTIHNFALKGDGVEMETSIDGKESPTWSVTFKAGDYTYVCDPHPSMSGSFSVT